MILFKCDKENIELHGFRNLLTVFKVFVVPKFVFQYMYYSFYSDALIIQGLWVIFFQRYF